nr:adenine phosphoribosyltransferase 1-like [Ipomoea batatas]
MEAITHQLALRLWEGNFGREKLPRYFEGGNLVRIKLPNTTASFSAAATTTTPKLAQPIRASAAAGARPEPDTTPFSSEMASHDPASKDTRIAQISSVIRVIPDFPKPERVGGTVVECACVIELPELKGRARLGDKPLFVLVSST